MENNLFRYLVKLKPINNFFFGGDINFGKLGEKENGSYLAKSRYFPQQTAVLGLIRRQMLVRHGLLTKKVKGEWINDDSKENAVKLVGAGIFEINNNNLDLGIIDKISPVFITKKDSYFFQINTFGDYIEESGKCFIDNNEKDFIPLLNNFDSKKGVSKTLVSKTERFNFSEIFREVEQIGNNKKETENALYKKTSYKFLDNYEFAFILELKTECFLEESIVSLGGDNSNFNMSFKKIDYSFEDLLKDISIAKNSITLFSDLYIEENLFSYCNFVVNNTISFQNIITKVFDNTGSRYKSKNLEISEKLYFYERGAVFFKPKEDLEKILTNTNLQKIGYNIFKKDENDGK